MSQKQCEKCGETVDEAKAFCPSCGEASVEEDKRAEASVFESMEGTMQLGNTMYNQMLSDMGLNISAKPDRSNKATEPSVTIPHSAIPAPSTGVQTEVSTTRPMTASGAKMWVIVGLIALALFFLILLVLFAAGYIFYRSQGA